MRTRYSSDHVQDIQDAYPGKIVQASISVDPLVSDGILRELAMVPLKRLIDNSGGVTMEQIKRQFSRILSEARYDETSFQFPSEIAALDAARRIAAEALADKNPSEGKNKANKALSISKDCAEAYIVLARLEADSKDKIKTLEKSVQIASKTLAQSKFQDPDGYFWQDLDTRPYMRCRTALALALWEAGDKRAAIAHLKELFRLNPYDDQGLRYHLLNWILDPVAKDPDIDEYFEEYESDRSAMLKYAVVFWKFIRSGNGKETQKALSDAVESNKFVPAVLAGRTQIPNLNMTRVERGTPLEAIAYYRLGADYWRKTPAALDWLVNSCSTLVSSKTILRKITTAQEFELKGPWVEPVPMGLFPDLLLD